MGAPEQSTRDHRRRRRRRFLTRVSLVIGLGGLTTIAIAWSLAAWLPHRDLRLVEYRGEYRWYDEEGGISLQPVCMELRRPGMCRREYYREHGAVGVPVAAMTPLSPLTRAVFAQTPPRITRRGLDECRTPMPLPDPLEWRGAQDARGWPMLALWCEFRIAGLERLFSKRPEVSIEGAIFLSNTPDPGYIPPWPLSVDLSEARALPLRPVWGGFAVNTLLFGSAWWLLLFSAGSLRRWQRSRRGACPRCGYDLRGLPAGMVCPECGRGIGQ